MNEADALDTANVSTVVLLGRWIQYEAERVGDTGEAGEVSRAADLQAPIGADTDASTPRDLFLIEAGKVPQRLEAFGDR